ncbi:subtilisin-like protein [Lactarius akahatsu]|uniref:tripeptidyl-peptidase II n=1 Tax=Lactarius akahatsu TaxID=416441 RepID=A0AAD4Q5E4_9AGAM|nr:subtilisin-like protein [Lactarius akahatsu]
MHIKHSWSAVPEDWVSLGHPPPGITIDLYIALKSHRENALRDTLYQVSEPSHPRYGAYLTNEQLAGLIAPHPETLELVNSWLAYQGIPSSSISITHGGDTLTLKDVPITQANALLNASYQLYRHAEHGETIVRTVGYALPVGLHRHVVTVAPTTSFFSPPPPMQWHAPPNGSDEETGELLRAASGEPATQLSNRDNVRSLEPSFLRWLYSTIAYKPAAIDRNSLGIVGFLREYPSPTDLKAFMRKYRSDGWRATYTVTRVNNGGYDPRRPAIEPNLDVQYAMAMTYPTPLIFYSTGFGRSNTGDWFLSFLGYFLRQRNGPKTISTSYCIDEKSYPLEYAINVCNQFGKLGLLGVSVLYATGDDGVGKDCTLSDGTVRFRPTFPATCPYVTAVGATTGFDPEVAADFSGGGFSDYFKIPDYQRQAVTGFFQILGDEYKGLYNATSRGIPDISAQSVGFNIFLNGREKRFDGTSCSTPVVASIIALINDHLISNGRPALGFLNPWLYGSAARSLFDVTSGTNPGCNTDGFSAVPGWDPVTGLGTPLGVFPGLSGLGSSSEGPPL